MGTQLILIGAPGSGKGTQAANLVKKYGYTHISTGDLLRKEVATGSSLGDKIAKLIDNGQLVDDATVLELINKNCDLSSNSYIFDGFPRNIDQARALHNKVLEGIPSKVIYFNLDLNVLLERLLNRRTCRDCNYIHNLVTNPPRIEGKCDSCSGELFQRKDDSREIVSNRLNVFRLTSGLMLDYYQTEGILHSVNASLDPEKVFSEIKKILG